MTDWLHRYAYAPPKEDRVYLERERVATTCPACGSGDVRRYPVAAHWGPRIVTKCQDCFHVLALERPTAADDWPPFRPVSYDWEASPSERASRDHESR
jgi:hypothetical protein